MELDALLLARLQFAFTISFHIIFPAFTIGLASYLAVLEGLWLRTGNDKFIRIYEFWVKIFAISFALGVVSGIVMSYQFGTNWSRFSEIAGNVIGPLLGYEVLTAFFLEASFLGIMLFGRGLVGPGLHFVATCIVAVGTLISAFWILAANSWMQYPTGHELLRDGVFYVTDWFAVVFSPTFPYRLIHMILASYLTTAFVVAGVAAYLMLRRRALGRIAHHVAHGVGLDRDPGAPATRRRSRTRAVGLRHPAEQVRRHRGSLAELSGQGSPYSHCLAGPEERDEPLRDQDPGDRQLRRHRQLERRNHRSPGIPARGQAERSDRVLGVPDHGRCRHADDPIRPHGGLAAWTGWIGRMRWFYPFLVLMLPSGFVAVLTGWIVAEVGRQPYTVYGLLRTADSVSPVAAGQVAMSLLVFIIVYAIVFTSGVFYMWRIASQGPVSDTKPPPSSPKPEKKAARESFKALDELREDIEDASKEAAHGNT